jgi:hypothetical protein
MAGSIEVNVLERRWLSNHFFIFYFSPLWCNLGSLWIAVPDQKLQLIVMILMAVFFLRLIALVHRSFGIGDRVRLVSRQFSNCRLTSPRLGRVAGADCWCIGCPPIGLATDSTPGPHAFHAGLSKRHDISFQLCLIANLPLYPFSPLT